jgi:coenzyme F420-dependent glucose-6-phosphate dehydrogenase
VELGYALSSEEHRPSDLVRHAREAEEAGFSFALVSDHFHPWTDNQGQSPFVWSVVGGIAETTERLRLGTGVTCPLIRIHPAVVAQAAATSAAMMEGRFFLGLGTGEELNEHVTGERWPGTQERIEMLEEAIWVIRRLWQGDLVTHHGRFFTVDRARIYTLPDEPPPIAVAAAGPDAAELAGREGDALVSTSPDADVVSAFERAGGSDKPRYGQLTVCYASSEREGVETAHTIWPNAAVKGQLTQELPLPVNYEQAAEMVTPQDVAEAIVCGPDPERYRKEIGEYEDAGFDHVYLHQVGPDQESFFRFARSELTLAAH